MAALSFSDNQMKLLADNNINFDYDNLSDDDIVELEELVGDLLVLKGLSDTYDDNEFGRRLRPILDALAAA